MIQMFLDYFSFLLFLWDSLIILPVKTFFQSFNLTHGLK